MMSGTRALYIFNDELVDKDAPGNILYGYVGKVHDVPEFILRAGAGYAQISAGTSQLLEWLPSFGDDPIDQKNIVRGIEYYNKIH